MSAFAGILRLDRGQADIGLAERMAVALRHQSSDDEGSYQSPDGGLALAGRSAGQPLSNETHDVWLVLDGAIYNHRALRHSLELDGHRFRTSADAEVALHGYEQWGLGMVEHLAGDFALALWDDRRDRLVLARDRLGRRPLFFAENGRSLSFASGLRPLAQSLDGPRRLDARALAGFLAFGHVLPPRTLVSGIHKLAPGEMLVADRDGPPYRSRWAGGPVDERRAASVRSQGGDRHIGNLRTLIECSVADRLMGDAKVGALIGPGLDGGVTASIMSRLTGRPVVAVTVLDEGNRNGAAASDARLLARAAHAELHEVAVGEEEAAAALPRMAAHLAEPLGDPATLLWWWAGRGCAAAGLSTVLAGEGADELLAAHPGYRHAEGFWLRLRNLLSGGRRDIGLPAAAGEPDWDALLGPAARAADCGRDSCHDIGRAVELPHWLAADRQGAAGWLDLTGRVAEAICPRVGAMSMAHGVSVRLPYLDDALVAYATAVPGRHRSPAGAPKLLFHRAIADLVPPELQGRAVTPPSLPMGRWLVTGPLSAAVEHAIAESNLFRHDVLAAKPARCLLGQHREGGDHTTALFGLLVLAEFYDSLGLDGVAPRESTWTGGAAELPLYSRS
jgi:asparagine synthase (glutamine-hydrolysing)